MKYFPSVLLILLFLVNSFNISAQSRGIEIQNVVGQNVTVGKQWAVSIAIDRYQEWSPLSNPVKDAKEIKSILQEQYYIDEIRELYDRDATNNGIRKLLGGLREQVGRDASVFVFFAGHGHTDDTSVGFWIPSDGQHSARGQANWLPNIQVRNMLSQLPAGYIYDIRTREGVTPIVTESRRSRTDYNSIMLVNE